MNEEKKLCLEYVRDPKMRPLAVHGVQGGLCQGGDLEVNLYTETKVHPRERELVYDGDTGILLYESSSEKEFAVRYQRKVHTRLILDKHMVRYLIEWLSHALETMEEDSGNADSGNDENIAKE